MSFDLTILGTSSALPTTGRYPTAQILNIHERFFLIDCGEGTQIQLRRYHVRFARISRIFISHLHGDHFFGLFGLLSSFSLLGRKEDLHVYAHAPLEKIFNSVNSPLPSADLEYNLIFHTLSETNREIIFEDEKIIVESFPLKHRIPVCGFLFTEKPGQLKLKKEAIGKYGLSIAQIVKAKNGEDITLDDGTYVFNHELTIPPPNPKTYAFCTDTIFLEKIIPIIKNATVLYHEATYDASKEEEAAKTGHTTALQAGRIAKLANVGKLIIGHYSSRYKETGILLEQAKSIFPNSIAAVEGLNISI